MPVTSLRSARRTVLLAAVLVSATVLPPAGSAADRGAGQDRTASSHYPPSRYGDPCEGRSAVDLHDVVIDDLFEDDRATVRSGAVAVEAVLCAPVPADQLRTVRVDLHPRLDTASGPDHRESPSRVLTIEPGVSGWTWRLRTATGSTITTGTATATTTADGVTGVVAHVGACDVAAATGGRCGPDRRLSDAPPGPVPPLAVRACTADVDCGPAYRTLDGRTEPDPASPMVGVDYLPDPRHYPPTYPSICQVGGVARVPSRVPSLELLVDAVAVPRLEAAGATSLGELPDGRRRMRGSLEQAVALVGADAVETVSLRRQQQTIGDGASPDDPWYGPDGPAAPTGQWSLRRVGLERARAVTTGDGVRVAIIDSGFDGRHPDLVGRAIAVRDYVPTRDGRTGVALDRSGDTDLGGHGTFVASVVAAATDDGAGMAALAPGARLLVARVFDAEGCASDGAVVEAMAWATASGAVALNLSLGGPGTSAVLEAAGIDAFSRGTLPVAAAGNSGGSLLEYPGAYAAYLSVAATGYIDPHSPDEDPVAPYSTGNAGVDLAAPGGSNRSSLPSHDVLGACWVSSAVGRGYCREAGTSFAAPHVTAAIALVRSLDPQRTAIGTEQALEDTARDIRTATGTGPGRDDRTGAGRIDLGHATTAVAKREDTLDDLPGTGEASAASVAVSRATFATGTATHAVIARNDVFADSLAGAPLAGDRGPILLVPPDRLPLSVETELRRVLPGGRVWILGGEGAVSPTVVERIRALGYSPARLHGPTRIDTAVAIARQVGPGPDGQVLVASAANWPDAIAGGAYAAAAEVPLLLSWPDSAAADRSPGVLTTARSLGARDLVVLGGEAAISGRVFGQLREVAPTRRVAGDNRFSTATAVARTLWRRTSYAPEHRYVVVNGDRPGGWAQGLASAPYAADRDAPLLLINDGLTTREPAAYLRSTVGYRLDRPAAGLLVGPATRTSDASTLQYTAQRIRELLGG
ncbi:MAG: S8 family serine peptidase [Actinobacteria bacterium]|nr:S8 family serine peptidase [Actinomycetota bacterium]